MHEEEEDATLRHQDRASTEEEEDATLDTKNAQAPKKKKTAHSDTTPPSIDKCPPDFVHSKLFLSRYIKIIGDISLDGFARCHCTQELIRMQWTWEEIREMPASSPHQSHGNWETADGLRFFCQWVDSCPPCEDALRGALLCHLDGDHDEYDFDDFCDVDYD